MCHWVRYGTSLYLVMQKIISIRVEKETFCNYNLMIHVVFKVFVLLVQSNACYKNVAGEKFHSFS